MKCPERPIRKVKMAKNSNGEHEATMTNDFGECYGSECPYYYKQLSYSMNESGGMYIEKSACRLVGKDG